MQTKDRSLSAAFWRVFLVTVAIKAILAGLLEPCYDEAYYFYFSLNPQLSYYDHPALTAWAIALSGFALGDSIWAIRIWPLLAGAAFTLLGRSLATGMFGPRAGNRAGILLALAPCFAGNGLLMTPDALFAAAWAATLFFTWMALAGSARQWAWWGVAGVSAGLGMLAKYNMALFFLGMALLWLFSAGRRREIFVGTVAAVLIAAAVFTPVVLWNSLNDWISFRFQLAHGFVKPGAPLGMRLLSYAGGLLAVVTPVAAILAFWSAVRGMRGVRISRDASGGKGEQREAQARLFLAVFFWCVVGFFAVSALRSNVMMNWPMLAFYSGLIAVAADWEGYAKASRVTALALMALACVVAVVALGYAALPEGWGIRVRGREAGVARLEEFTGGRATARAVLKAMKEANAEFVCVSRYQMFGKLAFFAPELRENLWLPRDGRRRFPWLDDRKWAGKNALIVVGAPGRVDRLAERFARIEEYGEAEIPSRGGRERKLAFYRGVWYSPPP